jgi:hypothetical protein
MKNNRFIFTNFLFFFIFLFIGRFLYPLGDEPDFFLRASKVINNVDHYNGPLNKNTDIYKYFRFFLKSLSENIECNIKSSPLSLFSIIDYKTCIDSSSNILARFFITSGYLLLMVIPIFLKKSFFIFKKIGMKCSLHEWNLRKRVFSLSLILPSIVYYAGALSSEQVTLFLSLLIFLFYGSSNFVAIIIFLILLIDIGSGLMVMCYYFFISIIVNFYKYFFYLIFFFILSLLLIIFFRQPLVYLISNYVPYIGYIFFHADNWMRELGVVEKYPLILRPVITYMSFIFLTPAKIKIIPLYIIFFIFLFKYFLNNIKKVLLIKKITFKNKNYFKKLLIFISSIYFILCIVFLLPSYAFSKYYIFMTPFFLYAIIDFYTEENMRKFFLLSNLLVFFNLLLYYILFI